VDLKTIATKLLAVLSYRHLGLFTFLLLLASYHLFNKTSFVFSQPDPMYCSALLAILVTGLFSVNLDRRLKASLIILQRRRVLDASDPDFASSHIIPRSNLLAFRIITGAIFDVIYLYVFSKDIQFLIMTGLFLRPSDFLIYEIIGVLGAFVIGTYYGDTISYSRLGHLLQRYGLRIRLFLGHPDGVCGLKPIGEYYFYQARLFLVPSIYLTIWWLLISLWRNSPTFAVYDYWRGRLIILVIGLVIMQLSSFVLPMIWFHRQMTLQKWDYVSKYSRLLDHLLQGNGGRSIELDAVTEHETAVSIDKVLSKYYEAERMPTWPIDWGTKKKFIVRIVASLSPLLFMLVQESGIARIVIEFFRDNIK
jgi:hypothetical protein